MYHVHHPEFRGPLYDIPEFSGIRAGLLTSTAFAVPHSDGLAADFHRHFPADCLSKQAKPGSIACIMHFITFRTALQALIFSSSVVYFTSFLYRN